MTEEEQRIHLDPESDADEADLEASAEVEVEASAEADKDPPGEALEETEETEETEEQTSGPWAWLKAEADARYNWSEKWARYRRWLPAIAFFTGFLIDAINLSIGVKFIDLVMVSVYGVGALMLLIGRTKVPSEKWKGWLTNGLQFCLGALFSAMVVLYFKSSGHIWSLIFVLGLFAAQVANEFLHRDDRQVKLVWAIYTVSTVMLLNFLIPHWTKSVSSIWFYLSTGLAVGIVAGVRRLTQESWDNLKVAGAAVAVLVLLFAVGAIPPVPLVLKHQLACVDFTKSAYSCGVDEESLLQVVGLQGPTVTRGKKPVYALTSVFAPDAIEVELQHEWHLDTDDGWKLIDTMNFTMRGGRKEGWRIWSRKRNPKAGNWRVKTRLKDGAVLGYQDFEVVEGSDEHPRVPTDL